MEHDPDTALQGTLLRTRVGQREMMCGIWECGHEGLLCLGHKRGEEYRLGLPYRTSKFDTNKWVGATCVFLELALGLDFSICLSNCHIFRIVIIIIIIKQSTTNRACSPSGVQQYVADASSTSIPCQVFIMTECPSCLCCHHSCGLWVAEGIPTSVHSLIMHALECPLQLHDAFRTERADVLGGTWDSCTELVHGTALTQLMLAKASWNRKVTQLGAQDVGLFEARLCYTCGVLRLRRLSTAHLPTAVGATKQFHKCLANMAPF
mmetsp:Transcript_89901/g.150250  ORF Transcript_89901/g.150250 Transcript_89901/m.150250 type:complete len:264 (+) Transcript_89901:1184-1975(+)